MTAQIKMQSRSGKQSKKTIQYMLYALHDVYNCQK